MQILDLSAAKLAVFTRRQEISKTQITAPSKKRALTPSNASALLSGTLGGLAGNFRGAQAGRLFADWNTWTRSADQCLQYQNRILRARSRSLEQNSGVASGFLLMCSNNIVGEGGVRMEPRPPMLRGDGINEDVAAQIREAWEDFCEPENFSADGRLGFVQLLDMLVRTWAREGESFARIVYDPSFKHGLAVDLMDPDQVDDWKWELGRPDGSSIRMGVEVDRYRRPMFYHCWAEHPSEVGFGTATQLKVPASQMLHVFVQHRPKQTRGYTWFAPVMVDVNHLDRFVEAAEVAARVGASQMAFVEQDDTDDYEGDGQNEDGTVRLDIEPGTIGVLPPGARVSEFNPNYPNVSFSEFVKQCTRFIASGLGVAYHNLGSDLSAVNFSSARAGTLSERDFWKKMQSLLIKQFCRPLFLKWLDVQLLGGQLSHLPYDRQRLGKVAWHPRRWEWVDPLKDVQAKALELQNGFTTREEIAAERGKDFLQIVEQLVREMKILDDNGLKLVTDIRGDDTTENDTEENDLRNQKSK